MAPTMTATSPTPDYQTKLEHQHKGKPRHERSLKPIHPLHNLPPELKMCIFDHLDPIDSTSLGLSSRHMYPTYRRRFLKPLPLHQSGGGQLALRWQDRAPRRGTKPTRPFCWKCGPNRCELHRHIQDFVGRGAFEKQKQRLKKNVLQHSGPCYYGFCAMKNMGFDTSTKFPCGCWGDRNTEAEALDFPKAA
ncbi:f-box domain-containing protein [Fusarium flagelliforme]|uniref:F-box domain-containing protein n=1 Tax=Fusarium flagelliforme TaxID=2675880 RepID=A0A395M606_9HYPO|nr:f-box domain-containing protein [Fusarium flagelliforme]